MSSGLVGSSINQGPERRQAPHPFDRFIDFPGLVGVHHQHDVVADDGFPDAPQAANVVVHISAHFKLDMPEALIHGLAGQPADFLVVVAQPAGRHRVGGVAVFLEVADSPIPRCDVSLHDRQGFVASQHVLDVTQVGAIDELFRSHFRQQAPDRLALGACPHVPDGVHDRAGGHVNNAFLGSQPANLAVRSKFFVVPLPISARISSKSFPTTRWLMASTALQQMSLPPPDREDEAEAPIAAFGLDGRHRVAGVVRVLVRGIGSVQLIGRGETHVARAQANDSVGHAQSSAGCLHMKLLEKRQ